MKYELRVTIDSDGDYDYEVFGLTKDQADNIIDKVNYMLSDLVSNDNFTMKLYIKRLRAMFVNDNEFLYAIYLLFSNFAYDMGYNDAASKMVASLSLAFDTMNNFNAT